MTHPDPRARGSLALGPTSPAAAALPGLGPDPGQWEVSSVSKRSPHMKGGSVWTRKPHGPSRALRSSSRLGARPLVGGPPAMERKARGLTGAQSISAG